MSEHKIELNDETVKKIIRDTTTRMESKIKYQVEENIESALKYQIERVVSDTMLEYIKKEIVPVVQLFMATHKEEIIKQLKESVDNIGTGITDVIKATFQERMKSSYNQKAVLKEMFGL